MQLTESKRKIAPFVENITESTTACLIMMVQGNLWRSRSAIRSWICGAVYPREADIRTLNSVAVDHVLEIFDSTINNHRSDEDECDAYHHPLSRPPVKHYAVDDCRVQLFTCIQPHKVWCV